MSKHTEYRCQDCEFTTTDGLHADEHTTATDHCVDDVEVDDEAVSDEPAD